MSKLDFDPLDAVKVKNSKSHKAGAVAHREGGGAPPGARARFCNVIRLSALSHAHTWPGRRGSAEQCVSYAHCVNCKRLLMTADGPPGERLKLTLSASAQN